MQVVNFTAHGDNICGDPQAAARFSIHAFSTSVTTTNQCNTVINFYTLRLLE